MSSPLFLVYLAAGMVTGVAFGGVPLASAPAIVALFALPIPTEARACLVKALSPPPRRYF
jgi:hypothetical protein